MRPYTVRAYTVHGRLGNYLVPTITAVDNRLTALTKMLQAATPEAAPRIRADIDTLLDWRIQLVQERGATT